MMFGAPLNDFISSVCNLSREILNVRKIQSVSNQSSPLAICIMLCKNKEKKNHILCIILQSHNLKRVFRHVRAYLEQKLRERKKIHSSFVEGM